MKEDNPDKNNKNEKFEKFVNLYKNLTYIDNYGGTLIIDCVIFFILIILCAYCQIGRAHV